MASRRESRFASAFFMCIHGLLSLAIAVQQPWRTANANRCQRPSLLDGAKRWPGSALERQGATAMRANAMNGLPDRCSHLARLASIAGGGVDAFWNESEIYRCATPASCCVVSITASGLPPSRSPKARRSRVSLASRRLPVATRPGTGRALTSGAIGAGPAGA